MGSALRFAEQRFGLLRSDNHLGGRAVEWEPVETGQGRHGELKELPEPNYRRDAGFGLVGSQKHRRLFAVGAVLDAGSHPMWALLVEQGCCFFVVAQLAGAGGGEFVFPGRAQQRFALLLRHALAGEGGPKGLP